MDEAGRFEKVQRVFAEACKRPSDERGVYVDEACAGDAGTRDEVLALLRSDSDGAAGRFLEQPVAPLPAVEATPEVVGGYRLLGLLGRGGMGVVYRAEQPVTRRLVALKLVLGEFVTPATIRRFEVEREVLARLQHPGIAQIYEAGTHETDAGARPFFAMELVPDATSLSDHAERHGLSIDARLALFVQVCDALQHAHEKGVIHRDLKPGNILVGTDGRVKVLDFGVARVIDAERRATLQTDIGQLVGTLPYMSPEQAAGDPGATDTRSDVYCLGVVLYELLTGRLPHDVSGKPPLEAARLIQEEPPTRMSTVRPSLSGDIETIAAKALAKEPERRYDSAAALGADVQRILHREPILARPATAIYQLRKFASRNKAAVSGAVLVVLALVVGLIGMTLERGKTLDALRNAREAQTLAERNERLHREVLSFLNEDLLAEAAPSRSGPNTTIGALLDRASDLIDDRMVESPDARAMTLSNIANLHWALGEFEKAEPLLVEALTEFEEALGPDDPMTMYARHDLGTFYMEMTRFDEAEVNLRRALADRRRVLGRDDRDALMTQRSLGEMLADAGRYEEAADLLEDAFETMRASAGNEFDTWRMADPLAGLFLEIGRQDEAIELYEQAYEFCTADPEAAGGFVLTVGNNLGAAYQRVGRYDDAIRMMQAVLDVERAQLGPGHPNSLPTMFNLARVYHEQERLEEAESLFRETLAGCRAGLPDGHMGTMMAMNNLAAVLVDLRRFDEAVLLQAEAQAALESSFGPAHPETLQGLCDQAMLLQAMEDHGGAEVLLRRAAAGFRARGG